MLTVLRILLALCLFATPAQAQLYLRTNSSTIPNPVTNQTYWFNNATGQVFRYTGTGYLQITPPFSNLAGSGPPTTSNDQTQGYQLGSIWFDATNKNFYIATSVATGAAQWDLYAGNNTNLANLALQPYIQNLTGGNFITPGLIPATSGTLLGTLPSGRAYVNGRALSVTGGTYTYTATKWTYDFVTSAGVIAHYPVTIGTGAPVVANAVCAYKVVTSASAITSVVPEIVVYPYADSLLATTFNTTSNQAAVFPQTIFTYTNAISQVRIQFGKLPPAAIATTGATTGQWLTNVSGIWAPQTFTFPSITGADIFGGQGVSGARTVSTNTTDAPGTIQQYTTYSVSTGVTHTVDYKTVIQTTGTATITGTLTGGTNSGGPSTGQVGLFSSGLSNGVNGAGGGGNGGAGGAGGYGTTKSMPPTYGGLSVPISVMQSSGGANQGSSTQGGGAVISLQSVGNISITGTVNCNGVTAAATSSNGGGSGGNFCAYSQGTLTVSSAGSILCNGGGGGSAASSNYGGGGGGGGGYILLMAPTVTTTGATLQVGGGAAGTGGSGSGAAGSAGVIYQITATPYAPVVAQLNKSLPLMTAFERIYNQSPVIQWDEGITPLLVSTAHPRGAVDALHLKMVFLGMNDNAQTCGGENANADQT